MTENFLRPVKLNERNFMIWKHQVLAIIKANGFEGFLHGGGKVPDEWLPLPEASSSNAVRNPNPDFCDWITTDSMLLSWMLSTIDDNTLNLVGDARHFHELWRSIAVKYLPTQPAEVDIDLNRKVYDATYQAQMKKISLNEEISKIDQELCAFMNQKAAQPQAQTNAKARVDFISFMTPDNCRTILGSLPTKYAVALASTSKEFQQLWESTDLERLSFFDVPNRFEYDDIGRRHGKLFKSFVDKIFQSVKLERVKSFQLVCYKTKDSDDLNRWVDLAWKYCKLVEFKILTENDNPVTLPLEMLTSTTLVVLTLWSRVRLDVPAGPIFPSLKVLKILVYDHNSDKFWTCKLYSRCPVLEDLDITTEVPPNKKIEFKIISKTVKSLRLYFHRGDGSVFEWFEPNKRYACKVTVKCDALDYLDISDFPGPTYSVKFKDNCHVLTNAKIHLDIDEFKGEDKHDKFVHHLFRCLAGHVKCLTVSSSTIAILSRHFTEAGGHVHTEDFPLLNALKLTIGVHMNALHVKHIMDFFLGSATALKSIHIHFSGIPGNVEIALRNWMLNYPRKSTNCQIHFSTSNTYFSSI